MLLKDIFMALHKTGIYFLPSKVRIRPEICGVDARPPPVSDCIQKKQHEALFRTCMGKKASVLTSNWSIQVSFRTWRDPFLTITQTTAKKPHTVPQSSFKCTEKYKKWVRWHDDERVIWHLLEQVVAQGMRDAATGWKEERETDEGHMISRSLYSCWEELEMKC